MKETMFEIEKLPIEHHPRAALMIYAKRLGIFLTVILINFGLLGVVIDVEVFAFFRRVIVAVLVTFLLSVLGWLLMQLALAQKPPHVAYCLTNPFLIYFFIALIVLIVTLGYGLVSLTLRLLT